MLEVIERSDGWLSAAADDELMMLNIERGIYVGLNAVSCRIWELLETPRDEAALCDALVAEFRVEPDQCRREVASFIDAAVAKGVVRRR